jgi:hypothetical protein
MQKLLFVHQFALDNAAFFEFHSSHFVIKDCMTGIPIHRGQLNNGLYHLFPLQVPSSPSQALVGERTTSHCWHKRLGHPALWIVNLILSKFQLPVSSNKASSPCNAYPQAKGHQLPFSISTTTICNPLDLIYLDAWGPSPTISINRNRYYVSFVDAFSIFTLVYPIQSKSDIMPIFLKFQLMAECLLNAKIKSVQTDWGGEYRNLNKYFQSVGIFYRVSCPHTHQQLGCVERKHQHLIDTTLVLLADGSLPKKFLDDACLTSCYLINRLPTPLLKNISPLENFFLKFRIINFSRYLDVLVFQISNLTILTNSPFGPNLVCSIIPKLVSFLSLRMSSFMKKYFIFLTILLNQLPPHQILPLSILSPFLFPYYPFHII